MCEIYAIITINFKICFSNIISDEIPPSLHANVYKIYIYLPEVHAFGTVIMSTEVFRLIICKKCRTRPPLAILYPIWISYLNNCRLTTKYS